MMVSAYANDEPETRLQRGERGRGFTPGQDFQVLV